MGEFCDSSASVEKRKEGVTYCHSWHTELAAAPWVSPAAAVPAAAQALVLEQHVVSVGLDLSGENRQR